MMLDGESKTCQARGCTYPARDKLLCEKHFGMLGRRERAYRAALYDDDLRRALAIAGNAIEIGHELEEAKPKAVATSASSWSEAIEASEVAQAPECEPVLDGASPSMAFCPHKPHPKQQAFLDLQCEEAFFGGAAGGGKSDALLMAALQYVHVAGYCALILRRSYTDLDKPGAIMQRSKDWLMSRPGAKWSEQHKRWTFETSDGGTSYLQFGYLSCPDDKFKYQSTEYQFVAFDELTHFEEESYLYLFSRLRKLVTSEVPIRMRSASNPGGRGHSWVMRRFVKPGLPDCVFVPSKLDDNPSLDAVAYRKSLDKLDKETREQLLDGVWGNGTPKYGAVTSVEADGVAPTYSILRIDADRAVRLGFALVNVKDPEDDSKVIGKRVTLVAADPYAVPHASDRMIVCTAPIMKEIRKEIRTRAQHSEPRKLRSVHLFQACRNVDIAAHLDMVWSALGSEPGDLPPVEDAILDALAISPTPRDMAIRVDRTDLSEQELLDRENGSTSVDAWWKPATSIGSLM